MPKGASQQKQAKKKVSQKGGESAPVQPTTSWLRGVFGNLFGNKSDDTTTSSAIVQPNATQPQESLLPKFTNVFSSKVIPTEQALPPSLPNKPTTIGGSKKKQTKQVNRDKKDSKNKN